MTESVAALVVMPKGPQRAAVRRMLVGLGFAVTAASDPYEGTARFAEGDTSLVVASAAGWRSADLAFLAAVRARSASAAVVVLVPAEKRALAAPAIEAGADAWLPEPVDLRELKALSARLLLAKRATAAPDAAGSALKRLAAEVGHAVNNPLQVLHLLLEEGPSARHPGWNADVTREASRIKAAVDVVVAYGRLADPQKAPLSLGALLAERLEAAESSGLVARVGTPSPSDAPVHADAGMASSAIDALIRFVAAKSDTRPALVRGVARRVRERGRPLAEAAIRGKGVHVPPAEWDGWLSTVLWTDERDRLPRPGLALPLAVARAHGGGLSRRDTDLGTVLALRLPPG